MGPRSEIPSGGGPLVYVTDLDQPVLSDDDHHHLARVRRVRDGDPVVLGDGVGGWRAARFAGHHPECDGERLTADRPEPPIAVAFALAKGAKPELAVQKLVELGVDVIRPFVAARSIVRWDEGKAAAALARWERVAIEAAMQSRRAWLPEVARMATFAEVARLPGACIADRDGSAARTPTGPSLDRPLVLTGPEGGWDDAERAAGLPVVGLGPGVLRAETAAITAGALLAALRSGLVHPTVPPPGT